MTDTIELSKIVIGRKRRKVDADKVDSLCESIRDVGLLQPIVVDTDYRLIAGNHRIEAYKQLGYTEIPAVIMSPQSALHAELAEIDENLTRNEGTALERGQYLARRKEIYELLHPETKKGANGGWHNNKGTKLENAKSAFSSETSEKTGRSKRTIQEDIQIATHIAPEVQDAIEDTPLADSKTDLLALASLPKEDQPAAALLMVSMAASEDSKASKRAALVKALKGATPEVIRIVELRKVDDIDTIEELKRLQVDAPDTFESILLSGHLQSSQSSCHVSDGYKAIKAVLKELSRDHAVLAAQERKQNAIDQASLLDAKYRVIYADPPWKYDNTMPDYFTEQADHYDLMTIPEIRDMPVKDMVEDDAVLFLWVTSPILEQSFEVIRAWGFKYKASFVWDKVKHNMGHYNSVRHEFLFVCVRGSCQPDVQRLFDSVVSIERSDKHSEKPEQFRQIIDTIYPYGKRIELFARVRAEGWDAYGNEISDTVLPGRKIANVA